MIPLTRPYFSNESIKKISKSIPDILKSGTLMMGKWNEKLETNFSKMIGCEYSLTTNTCTSAIQIALEYFKVKGFDILVPSGSFQSGISAIKWAGAKPILVDMNPSTLSFSLEDLKKKITAKTLFIYTISGLSNFIFPVLAFISNLFPKLSVDV